jgi:hypothetical protein
MKNNDIYKIIIICNDIIMEISNYNPAKNDCNLSKDSISSKIIE